MINYRHLMPTVYLFMALWMTVREFSSPLGRGIFISDGLMTVGQRWEAKLKVKRLITLLRSLLLPITYSGFWSSHLAFGTFQTHLSQLAAFCDNFTTVKHFIGMGGEEKVEGEKVKGEKRNICNASGKIY